MTSEHVTEREGGTSHREPASPSASGSPTEDPPSLAPELGLWTAGREAQPTRGHLTGHLTPPSPPAGGRSQRDTGDHSHLTPPSPPAGGGVTERQVFTLT